MFSVTRIVLMIGPPLWALSFVSNGQSTSTNSTTKKQEQDLPFALVDMRGKGPINEAGVADRASAKHFTVLEVHGNDSAINKNAVDTMLGIYHSGRKRVGIVIADGDPKVWTVWAEGDIFNEFENADARLKTNILAEGEIIAAYDDITAPAWKVAQEKGQEKSSPPRQNRSKNCY